jgi:NADPH:quinone reductase-like Zn-dependent oxidoreductase
MSGTTQAFGGGSRIGPALRVSKQAATIADLAPAVMDVAPVVQDGRCLIEVHAAGVNMSDVKAALGQMPHAVWPRTPGRDYAGVVVQGPAHLMGRQVWGSSGELGIRRDGTHARYVSVAVEEVRDKPSTITLDEAGAVGVPFVTAFEGLQEAGGVKPTDVVLVLGGNGKVGQAAIQLAAAAGARVFAAVRRAEPYAGFACADVAMIDASHQDIAAVVREHTGGHGADIVYNTMGSPYFAAGNDAMAMGGRQIFISTLDRAVPFDIFRFYRGRHRFIGVDSLGLSGVAVAGMLEAMKPGFESGKLKPFPVLPSAVFSLAQAREAYAAVLASARDRIVLRPGSAERL